MEMVRHVRDGRRHRVRTGLLMVTTAMATLGLPVHAPAAPEQAPPAVAQARQTSFDIPPQPLVEALALFGRQSGMQVSGDAGLIRGKSSPGVAGTMAPEQALSRLLAGTGITYRLTGDTAMLRAVSGESGETVLGPVTVEGKGGTVYGPVDGYVATRSSTATKTDTPIHEVPQSISVITRDQFEARAAQRLDETLRYTAGVNATTFFNSSTTDPFSIRGFSATPLTDGLRASNNGFDTVVEPYGVERIEVLRGPSSVLYGQSGPGGVVNVVTKRPTLEPLHEIQLHGGDFDRKQLGVDISESMDNEKSLLYRITAVVRKSDTQTDFIPDDRLYIAPSFTWRPSEDTDLTLLTRYESDRSAFPVLLPLAGTLQDNPNGEISRNRFAGEPGFDRNDKDVMSAGYDFSHDVNDTLRLRQNFRFFDSKVDRREIVILALAADSRTATRRAEFRPQSSNVLSVDTNANYTLTAGPFEANLLAGVDFLDTRFASQRFRGTATTLDIFDPIYGGAVATPNLIADSKQELSQVGTYLQGQFKLHSSLVLTLAGRYDWADSTTLNRLTGVESKQNDEAFTGKAGLGYLFDNGLAPYISYATSFEPVIGTDAQSQPFVPETGIQYEAGLKYQPSGYNASLTGAIFHATRENVTTSDPDNPGFNVQTGEVTSKGFELEALASVSEGLDIIGSYTFLDAEVTKSNGTDLGQRPAYEPRHLASLWADYTLQEGWAEGFGVGFGGRYVGTTFSSDGSIEIPSVITADAAIHYTNGPLNVSLNATNLFDKRYVIRCFTSGCYFGDARTVRLTTTFRW